jgi:hypothetical protein
MNTFVVFYDNPELSSLTRQTLQPHEILHPGLFITLEEKFQQFCLEGMKKFSAWSFISTFRNFLLAKKVRNRKEPSTLNQEFLSLLSSFPETHFFATIVFLFRCFSALET